MLAIRFNFDGLFSYRGRLFDLILMMGRAAHAAGVREEPEGRAALHLRLAAGVLVLPAQSARLPLPWYVAGRLACCLLYA